MPTIIPFKLKRIDTTELEFKINQTGIRKYLRIPRVFSFPYFSGTMFELELEIINHSKEAREIDCTVRVYLLLPRISLQESGEDQKLVKGGRVTIGHSGTGKIRLRFANLPQPGNYIVRLDCKENGKSLDINRDIMYFDALPKDGSTFNVAIIITSGLIGVVIGLIVGRMING